MKSISSYKTANEEVRNLATTETEVASIGDQRPGLYCLLLLLLLYYYV